MNRWLARALLVTAAVIILPDVTSDRFDLGVSQAEARTYTRKRVKGRWVTGNFTTKNDRREKNAKSKRGDDDDEKPTKAVVKDTPTPAKVEKAVLVAPQSPKISEPVVPIQVIYDLKEGTKFILFSDKSVTEEPVSEEELIRIRDSEAHKKLHDAMLKKAKDLSLEATAKPPQ